MGREMRLLYLMEILAGLARGSCQSCISWTTILLIDSVATVDQMFIVQSVIILLLSGLATILLSFLFLLYKKAPVSADSG